MKIARVSVFLLVAAVSASCATPLTVYKGIYTWGAEVETFSPCDSNKTWWVLASEPVWLQLRNAHQSLTTKPYEGIYAEVSGAYVGAATEELGVAFAAQYDGILRITDVKVTRKRLGSDCPRPSP